MVWISLTAGRTIGRVVLRGIAAYFVLFAPAARRASRGFLARALGRPATLRDVYRHVLWFASTIHDRVFLLSGRGRQLQVEVVGAEALHQALADGRGCLLVGAHLGSFEALRAMGRERAQLRVAMCMYEENARKINQTLQAINPAAMQDIIALGRMDSMLAVRDRLDQGYLVGLLADRSIGADAGLTLPFLGAPARFPTGPWRLALMLRRPVFLMAGLYLGGNRYQLRFEPLADFSAVPQGQLRAAVEQAVRHYAQSLERLVRESPWNWFNFYDFWEQR
ncbi:acyl-CoA synthetase [Melaminivora suipulveris]|uniref:Acyl-CoA synthetase n=2 Tax=Melaminivora suipulveris TaxID=2109913 RepID=A0A2R3QGY4_9BURK|nr:acyl-CoA synthetase [Melaminivora suipulveris]